jgi:hypothetical protein
MTITFIGEGHGQVTNNSLTITLPAGIQGQDTILGFCGSLDSTVAAPSGFTELGRNLTSTLLSLAESKQAAGTVGVASADASAAMAWNVALPGQNHKTSACAVVFRGTNAAAPVNVSAVNNPTGTTSYVGPSVTTTVDNCVIVSVFIDKDSTNPLNITVPSGYTQRSASVFTSGSGKANVVVASKAGGSAGAYGADTWTTDAIPGAVTVYTVAIAPVATTQTIRPASDVTVTNATGVTVNTAGNLYTNIDETTVNYTDYVEFIASAVYVTGLTLLYSPGVNTGFSVQTVFRLGSGSTSASFAVVLKQTSTTIESWTVTVTADQQVDTHAISSGNAATIDFTPDPATDLRLSYTLTSVS